MSLRKMHRTQEPCLQGMHRSQLFNPRRQLRPTVQHVQRVLPGHTETLPILLTQHRMPGRIDRSLLRASRMQIDRQDPVRSLLLIALYYPQSE